MSEKAGLKALSMLPLLDAVAVTDWNSKAAIAMRVEIGLRIDYSEIKRWIETPRMARSGLGLKRSKVARVP
jgi:hypothetical protein